MVKSRSGKSGSHRDRNGNRIGKKEPTAIYSKRKHQPFFFRSINFQTLLIKSFK